MLLVEDRVRRLVPLAIAALVSLALALFFTGLVRGVGSVVGSFSFLALLYLNARQCHVVRLRGETLLVNDKAYAFSDVELSTLTHTFRGPQFTLRLPERDIHVTPASFRNISAAYRRLDQVL